MSDRYPNANYPEAYAEANMVKATDVDVNTDGGLLTVTQVSAQNAPLFENAVVATDVEGTTLHSGAVPTPEPQVEEPVAEPAVEEVVEAPAPAPAPAATDLSDPFSS